MIRITSRKAIYARDNYTCQYCINQFPLDALTLDHLIPTSKGGKNHKENLVTCCIPCNKKKGNRLPLNFIFKKNNWFGILNPEKPVNSKKAAKKRKAENYKKKNYDKNNGCCAYCLTPLTLQEGTMSQLFPTIRGGKEEKNNIVLACSRCNDKKNNMCMMPLDFIAFLNGWTELEYYSKKLKLIATRKKLIKQIEAYQVQVDYLGMLIDNFTIPTKKDVSCQKEQQQLSVCHTMNTNI